MCRSRAAQEHRNPAGERRLRRNSVTRWVGEPLDYQFLQWWAGRPAIGRGSLDGSEEQSIVETDAQTMNAMRPTILTKLEIDTQAESRRIAQFDRFVTERSQARISLRL